MYKVRESLMKKVMSELRPESSETGPSGSWGNRAPGRGNGKGRALRSECAYCDGNTELEAVDKALSFTDRSNDNQASPREMPSSEGPGAKRETQMGQKLQKGYLVES